jgi:hypothetical protein
VKQPDKEKHNEKPEPAASEKSTGIVQPMIDELLQHPKDAPVPLGAPPRGPVHPREPKEEPAELDQDPGGGYNPGGTFPQT